MGKLATSIMILSFVLIGFHFAGLIENTPTDVLLNLLISPETLSTSSIYTTIVSILGIAAVAGVAIGILGGGKVQWALTGGLALIFLAVLWDIVRIYEIIAETNVMLGVFLVSPLIISYMIIVLEWWMNRD